jgi:hypothetical protein
MHKGFKANAISLIPRIREHSREEHCCVDRVKTTQKRSDLIMLRKKLAWRDVGNETG